MAISYLISPDGYLIGDPSGDIVVENFSLSVIAYTARSDANLPPRRSGGALAAARAVGVLPGRRLS